MANIKITIEGPLMDGHRITFKAPCDSSMVEKLDARYMENNTQKSKLFTMKDSLENDLTGAGNLFSAGAYVSVVLNPNNGSAYLLNANTAPVDNLESDRADLPLSARQGKILNDSLGRLQYGKASTEISSNSYKDIAITFERPYTSVPCVVVSRNTNAIDASMAVNCQVDTNRITTDGFNVRIFNSNSSSTNFNIHWIALGN